MCPFIDALKEQRFVETICVEKGEAQRLSFHDARLNRTRLEVFGRKEPIDLASFIHPELYQQRTKCRVVYAEDVMKVEFIPYRMRPVRSLRLVPADTIDYRYKSTNRLCLIDAFQLRGTSDDVLIVRKGLITDTSICNVAFWNGSEWLTPRRPLLEGTRRASLLREGRIQTADISVDDLGDFSRVRMFNALIGFGEQECDYTKISW